MSYVQLRRTILPNPDTQPGSLPYVALTLYWDTTARTYYPTELPSADNSTQELAVGTEVQRITNTSTGKDKIIYYAGYGQVQTKMATGAGSGGAVCTLAQPALTPNPPTTSAAGASDASLDVLPVLGAGPYQVRLTGPGSFDQTKTAPNAIYPVRFYSLEDSLTTNYTYTITDALGCQVSGQVRVNPGLGRPYGTVLQEAYYGDDTSGTGTRIIWNPNSLAVENDPYQGGGTDGYQYQYPYGQPVDGYYLPDGVTFRQVYSDGQGQVYFRDSNTTNTAGHLRLNNLILFNPDTAAEQNGGALLEVETTDGPLSFTLGSTTNATGSFDGLAAGAYSASVSDAAGRTLAVPFVLTLDYGLRWVLDFADLNQVPLRLELWLAGYLGEPETICGQGGDPVVIKSDGLNTSLGGQGDLPPVVGKSCEIKLYAMPGEFARMVTGTDRDCRCDVYRAGRLQFRGYVQPGVYAEPLRAGNLAVAFTAVDGLAALKSTNMLGHVGQRLGGRWPILHTLLHCLSRTGISLPVLDFVNRRDTAMSDDDAPEQLTTTERAGYWDEGKDEPVDMRSVVDGLCQALGGTLVQREGQWQLRSPLEALADAPGRAYRPAGTSAGAAVAASPSGQILPLSQPDADWGWVKAGQQRQVRPGWKSLTGTTNAGWQKNAFPAGEVFSDKYSFVTDGSQLRPIGGWLAAPTGPGFPLVLVQGGQKGTDYATEWLRSSAYGTVDANYLESPPLPLVADPESCPAYLTISGKLIPADYLQNGVFPAVKGTAAKATLSYEVVIDGQPATVLSTFVFELAGNLSAADTTLTVPLTALPAGTKTAVLRLYAWTAPNTDLLLIARKLDPNDHTTYTQYGDVVKWDFGTGVYRVFESQVIAPPGIFPTGQPNDPYFVELSANNYSSGRLLITSVGIELRPQQATWDGEDNFRADGPAGTVRPTEALTLAHPDVPIQAGLFEGNRYAFNKALALLDGGLTTAWQRAVDKQPAPMLEATVYDALALRAGNSQLLTGLVRHRQAGPPLLLDSVDLPFEPVVVGRRFLVGADEWNLKRAETEVSLLEIGPGADAPDPLLELDGLQVRISDGLYLYALGKYSPYVRSTDDGSVRVYAE